MSALRKALHDAFGSDSEEEIENTTSAECHAVVPGLSVVRGFLSPSAQSALLQAICASKWLSCREDVELAAPTQAHRFGDFPPWLAALAHAALSVSYGRGLLPSPELFDQAIVNEYRPGQGLTPHVDLAAFADGICGVSLGHEAIMRFSDGRSQPHDVLLRPGDLVCMQSDARYRWTHELLPSTGTTAGWWRLSVTLRRMQNVPHTLNHAADDA